MRLRNFYLLGFTVMLLLALLMPWPSVAQSTTPVVGRVLQVVSGNTLELLVSDGDDRQLVRMGLAGVVSPELDQPFGVEAQVFLAALLSNADVEIHDIQAAGGEARGQVVIHGGDVNLYLVEMGFAKLSGSPINDPRYPAAEKAARDQRRGLWSQQSPPANESPQTMPLKAGALRL